MAEWAVKHYILAPVIAFEVLVLAVQGFKLIIDASFREAVTQAIAGL
ncbi:MAG: hypothetical protein NT170_01020 [Candidatus Moranbacteria bacterium]|nr:hypothetical protein [Candidatus Moranbacteria bacterium]